MKKDEKIKREDVKIHPDVKRALQKEAGRINVYDYQITEEAIRRFLLETRSIPEDAGKIDSTALLPEHDRALIADVMEILKDPNGSYRATVEDTVQTWKTGPEKTTSQAPGEAKPTRNAKARRA